MPYIGRAPTGTGSVTEIDGDLKITGQLTANDTLFKMIMDTAANLGDNFLIEDGGTDGSGTNAGDDICLEKDLPSTNTQDLPSGGTVLQRVKVFSTAAVTLSGNIPVDATIPQIDEGTELYTLAITPKSEDSVLYFHGIIAATPDSGSIDLVMPMFVDTTANAIFTSYNYSVAVNYRVQSVIYGSVASGSTSARTYRLRVGANSSTDLEINQMNGAGGKFGGTWGSGFEITEVAN